MKMKKPIAVILASLMIFSISACGGKTENSSTAVSEETQAAEQEPAKEAAEEAAEQVEVNPITPYEGAYSDENGSGMYILFEAADDIDGVLISIGYPEETAYTYWEITGKIKENVITYEDAYKFSMDWGAPDQDEVSEEQIYSDGTGTMEIAADGSFTWKDDKEDAGKGMVFVWDEEMNSIIAEQMAQMEGEDTLFDDDSQNPAMNWAGPYVDINKKERTMQIISGDAGTSECIVSVTDTPSTDQTISWLMNGVLDQTTMAITYTGAVKKVYAIDAQGNQVSEETVYDNGTGSFVIDDDVQEITWIDDMEDAGNGSVFVFSFDYGEEGAYDAWTGEPAAEAY